MEKTKMREINPKLDPISHQQMFEIVVKEAIEALEKRVNGIDMAVIDLAKDFHSGDLAQLFSRVKTLEEARQRQIQLNQQFLEKAKELEKSQSKPQRSLLDIIFKR